MLRRNGMPEKRRYIEIARILVFFSFGAVLPSCGMPDIPDKEPGWNIRIIDPDKGSGRGIGLSVHPSRGRVHVAYYDDTKTSLKYYSQDDPKMLGTSKVLVGEGGTATDGVITGSRVGLFPSIALSPGGSPWMVFHQAGALTGTRENLETSTGSDTSSDSIPSTTSASAISGAISFLSSFNDRNRLLLYRGSSNTVTPIDTLGGAYTSITSVSEERALIAYCSYRPASCALEGGGRAWSGRVYRRWYLVGAIR